MKRISRNKNLIRAVTVLLVMAALFATFHLGSMYSNDSVASEISDFTIGTAEASIPVDYTCDGVNDNIQFQSAMDALPVTGGSITFLSGNYSFSTEVDRAIDYVTISGVGYGCNVTNPTGYAFSAGSQEGWVFSNFACDSNDISVSSASRYILENIKMGTDYIGFQASSDWDGSDFNIPVGRAATIAIAASDASDSERAQADVVCDGVDDQVEWAATLAYASGLGCNATIQGIGNFIFSDGLVLVSGVDIRLDGEITVVSDVATDYISCNSLTDILWDGGVIRRQGTITGQGCGLIVSGTTDNSVLFQNVDFISELVENITEQVGAVRVAEGTPRFKMCRFYGSDDATGANSCGILLGG